MHSVGTKIKTRDRILKTALELFNEEGEAQTSTVEIAATLGISPGNLYYHFKGKEVIIEALFDDFETEITQVLSAPISKPLALEDNWVFVYILFEEIYDFKFFYQNMASILERCPALRSKFSRILALKERTVTAVLSALEGAGFIAFRHGEKSALAERICAHLTFWLQFYALRYNSKSQKNLIHDGVYTALVQVTPYLTEKDNPYPEILAEFFHHQKS